MLRADNNHNTKRNIRLHCLGKTVSSRHTIVRQVFYLAQELSLGVVFLQSPLPW